MNRSIIVGLLAGALLTTAAPAPATQPAPKALVGAFADNSAQYWQVRPSSMMIARLMIVGEVDGRGGLSWSRWGSRKAKGVGTLWVEECDPSCAGGTFEDKGRVQVRLSSPRNGRFQRLTLTGAVNQQYRLHKTSGYWNW